MRKFSEKFRSKYLRASDIQGDKAVVIAKITEEEVGRDREEKVVIYFKGMPRGLVLNRPNGARLAGSLGDDMDGWIGQTVTLTTEWTNFEGEEIEAIRVRVNEKFRQERRPPTALEAQIAAQAPLTRDDLDDDVPF
jgi:hypothetical protein